MYTFLNKLRKLRENKFLILLTLKVIDVALN